MKYRLLALTLLMAVLATPVLQAQVHYTVKTLGTLGGSSSGASGINNRGWISGVSNVADDTASRATLWYNGDVKDLGTLGGENSAVAWPVKSEHAIVGIAETADVNPYGEKWSCAPFFGHTTHHNCLGFVWQNGQMSPLPTLGGYNGYAAAANNQGQVAGWAENNVHDPSCVLPQVLQFRAVIWGPGRNQITELAPYPGDTTSAATAINDKGEAVGISGICDKAVGRFSAKHMLLWHEGHVTTIDTLGGAAWNTPAAINNQGVVVGFSDLPGDAGGAPNFNGFVWTKDGGTHQLKPLDGDAISIAYGINDKNQIVGQSCGDICSAVIWINDKAVDLNQWVPAGTQHLYYANDINDRGEIVGQACTLADCSSTSEAFVATPQPSEK